AFIMIRTIPRRKTMPTPTKIFVLQDQRFLCLFWVCELMMVLFISVSYSMSWIFQAIDNIRINEIYRKSASMTNRIKGRKYREASCSRKLLCLQSVHIKGLSSKLRDDKTFPPIKASDSCSSCATS